MKKVFTIILAGVLFLLISACGKNGNNAPTTQTYNNENIILGTPSDDTVIKEITSAEYIDIEDAYNKLNSMNLELESLAFLDKLKLLKNCSGRFVQQSESSGNRYTADVAFYLSDGDVYCSVDYNGYMGKITDGRVQETSKDEYYFEAFPKGDLYGREQDFNIYFGNEKLYISWADTCEYTLTRGDGSVENAQGRHESFEETGMLDTIKDLIEQTFPNNEYNVDYDKDNSAIFIFIQFDGARRVLSTNNTEKLSAWGNVVDSLCAWNEEVYKAAKIPMYEKDGIFWPYVFDVHVFVVDKIKTSGNYSENEMLLWVDNGLVKYNVISDNTQTDNHTATSGERNALKSAQNYLSVMAFSYRGLVEQLEYEGYTTSEAEYAADNCGVDWNLQAVKKAKEYLAVMSFSKDGLLEQLEYEGFTHSQATYGVEQAY